MSEAIESIVLAVRRRAPGRGYVVADEPPDWAKAPVIRPEDCGVTASDDWSQSMHDFDTAVDLQLDGFLEGLLEISDRLGLTDEQATTVARGFGTDLADWLTEEREHQITMGNR